MNFKSHLQPNLQNSSFAAGNDVLSLQKYLQSNFYTLLQRNRFQRESIAIRKSENGKDLDVHRRRKVYLPYLGVADPQQDDFFLARQHLDGRNHLVALGALDHVVLLQQNSA
jgi:hypothetical protein